MPQMPQAFVGGNKAVDVATTLVADLSWAPGNCSFEDVQQLHGVGAWIS